jgi:hypothetical protein
MSKERNPITYQELCERGIEDGAMKHFIHKCPVTAYEVKWRGAADCLKKEMKISDIEDLKYFENKREICLPIPESYFKK